MVPEGEEQKLGLEVEGEDNTKIPMDQYYQDEYDQYDEGTVFLTYFTFFDQIFLFPEIEAFLCRNKLIQFVLKLLRESYLMSHLLKKTLLLRET